MTSTGANTWNVPLLINNLESQIASGGGGGGGVTSISAGTGISVSGSTGAVTVTNAGVTQLVAGTNITLSAGTGTVTIDATPVTTGVTSIIAGTNVTISPVGGTGAVTVNAVATPLPATGPTIDIYGVTSPSISAAQLANCYIYSSLFIPSILYPSTTYNITLPTYSALLAQYGAQAVIPFTIGNFRTTSATIRFIGDASIFIGSNFSGASTGGLFPLVAQNPIVGTTGYVLFNGGFWRGYCVLDPTNSIAYYTINYLTSVAFT